MASQAVRNAARSRVGTSGRVEDTGAAAGSRGPRARPPATASVTGRERPERLSAPGAGGTGRERRDRSHAPSVASHAMAKPMLIHSHSEGDCADVGWRADAAGAGDFRVADAGVAVDATLPGALLVEAVLTGALLPAAGRMVSVRAGNVAVRGWLFCVSHQVTVSAGIV